MKSKNRTKHRAFILLLIVFIMGIAGCGAKGAREETQYDSAQPEIYTEQQEEKGDGFGNSDTANGKTQENTATDAAYGKIIRNAYVEVQTKDFDVAVTGITDKINAVGGYIEQSELTGKRITTSGRVQNRRATFTLRVPKESFQRILTGFSEFGNVITSQTSSEDITGQYFDTEARLAAKKVQEQRLLSILEKAETVEDVIKLEASLAEVRYEIENFTGTIKKWDNLIDYTTIQVNVSEVQEISETKDEPVALGERMGDGFEKSIKTLGELLEGILIALVMILPFAVVIGLMVIPVWLLWRFIKRKQIDRNGEEK